MSNHILLPEDQDIPENLLARLKQNPPINIYRLLTLLPECFDPWLDMVNGLYHISFNKRLKEIAICRQSYKAKAAYERHQHTFIAKQNGVSEQELQIIFSEKVVKSLDPEANFICKIADELEENATLSDASFDELFARYGTKKSLEIITLIAFYCCVARVLNASRIPIEKTNPLEGLGSPIK